LSRFKDGSIAESVKEYEAKYGNFKDFLDERAFHKARYTAKLEEHNGVPPKHDCGKYKKNETKL
jgi:hypothetical protein